MQEYQMCNAINILPTLNKQDTQSAFKHPKHTGLRMENDITHKQNSADHKLVTQNIKHGATTRIL